MGPRALHMECTHLGKIAHATRHVRALGARPANPVRLAETGSLTGAPRQALPVEKLTVADGFGQHDLERLRTVALAIR